MKKIVYFLLAALLLHSCRTQRDVLYFQNIDQVDLNQGDLANINDYKLQAGDDLSINVSVDDKELLAPFTLNLSSPTVNSGNNTQGITTYTIDSEGNINFPQIGKIHLLGKTRTEAIAELTAQFSRYLKNPVVNLKVNNFRVVVLGDSGGRVVNIKNENANILEVLAESGDLKKTSDIDNLLLVRTENNKRTKYTVNLKDANLFNEPYFYVKQNDIIYIKPSKASTLSFNNTPFAAISTILSLGVTIYALFIK
uniref:polysaccharide biosynthesis/export family protein n=1 Tax=Ornithobacterium rhinotracheale TaxID=28251 RepID=UPI0039A4C070